MKNLLTVSALLLLLSVNALAGSEYDRCVKEEKALKTRETSECSGLRYLLNPSACFATRKALKEYTSGKCKNTATTENVDVSDQNVTPARKFVSDVSTKQKKVETEVVQQGSSYQQLKEENARLRAEIIRLTAENDQLRKAGR